ncbi:MAG: ankyrin repeat domain-containing protein [Gammaproteobacteria bacterium]|nr:ankyrin repeat domain-containing protein [Gammaproteobacteria bacterium]
MQAGAGAGVEVIEAKPDFSGRYSNKVVKSLLTYYFERKNTAGVHLIIAESKKDSIGIEVFEQTQIALANGERFRSKLAVVTLIQGEEADPTMHWSLSTSDYTESISSPSIKSYDPFNKTMSDDFNKDADSIIVEIVREYMQTGSSPDIHEILTAKARNIHLVDYENAQLLTNSFDGKEALASAYAKLTDVSNAYEKTVIEEKIKAKLAELNKEGRILWQEGGGASEFKEAEDKMPIRLNTDSSTIEQAKDVLAHLSLYQQDQAKEWYELIAEFERPGKSTESAGLIAAPVLNPIRFTEPLTESRLPELAVIAAKAGNTQFLEVLLNVKLGSNFAITKLIPAEESNKRLKDKYQFIKDNLKLMMVRVEVSSRVYYLNEMLDKDAVIESNEALLLRLNNSVVEDVNHLINPFIEDAKSAMLVHKKEGVRNTAELLEEDIKEFWRTAENVIEEGRIGASNVVNNTLTPLENARELLDDTNAMLKVLDKQFEGPPRLTESTEESAFFERLGKERSAKQAQLEQLITKYKAKPGLIQGYEDIPLNEALDDDSKALITSALLDIDFQDEEGNTFLHHALANKHHETVSKLVRLGARTDLRCVGGETAQEMAIRLGQLECMHSIKPESPDVKACNDGIGMCRSLIAQKLKPKIDFFIIETDKILNTLFETDPKNHLLEYRRREEDILAIRDALAPIEAMCVLFGDNINAELPVFIDQFISFSHDILSRSISLKEEKLVLEKEFVADESVGIRLTLSRQRFNLYDAWSKEIAIYRAGSEFDLLYKAARKFELKSANPDRVFNVAKRNAQTAVCLAMEKVRADILKPEISVLTAKLKAEKLEEKNATVQNAIIQADIVSLEKMIKPLKSDIADLTRQKNDAETEAMLLEALIGDVTELRSKINHQVARLAEAGVFSVVRPAELVNVAPNPMN